MADEPINLALEHLKRIPVTPTHAITPDIGEPTPRMTEVGFRFGDMTRMIGHLEVQVAPTNGGIERTDERLTRIERRLDPIEA